MKPRHADLFASDLDDETLIRTVDRFLMFYIRTADRLQRTSTWMDNLEGGLDYLREVILNDSLGIAHELEQEMAGGGNLPVRMANHAQRSQPSGAVPHDGERDRAG
jgi:NAD(P)H-nitrite reductase large subunit